MSVFFRGNLKSIFSEFRTLYYSKVILALILALFFTTILILFMNYKDITMSYQDYNRIVDMYENEEDMTEDLENGNYNLKEKNGSYVVENPLLYYNKQISKSLFVISPKYILTQMLEAGIIFFPIIFGIFGLILGSSDYRNKTIKNKVSRIGKKKFYFSKFFVSILIIFFLLLFFMIFSKMAGTIVYNEICNKIPIKDFKIENLPISSNIFLKFSFSFLISILYSSIGMFIGVITKGTIFGVFSIVAYAYAVPTFSKFDLKNSYYFIMEQLSDFYGVINISDIKESSLLISMTIILGILLFTNIVTYLLVKNRSAFE